jgi:N-acetylneuraminic acid mutarotase
MLTARLYLAVVALRGRVYAIGGFDGVDIFARVEEYDPGTNSWRARAQMEMPRYFHSAAVANGRIYVFGGFTPFGPTASVEEYDPATDEWVSRRPLNWEDVLLGAATVGNEIIVPGGAAFDPTVHRIYRVPEFLYVHQID